MRKRITNQTAVAPAADQRRAGVTLVELLLVLGVLVVMVSVTLPGVLRWQRAMPMEQAVSTMQLQLQETRATAIRTGESWCLILPNGRMPGRRKPLEHRETTDQHHSFQLPAGVRCEIVGIADQPREQTESPDKIVFHPDGTVRGCCLKIVTETGCVATLQIHRMTGTATVVQQSALQPLSICRAAEVDSERSTWRCPNSIVAGRTTRVYRCRIPEARVIS